MLGHRQISRVRWGESDKQRLLDFRDNYPDWSWEAITEIFPGRSATGLCKMYSDLKKIKREEEAARMANNDDEETEETGEMENNDDEGTEEMADQENNDDEASEAMENNDNEASEETASDDDESTEETANDEEEESTEEMFGQANDDNAATEEMANNDQANNGDEATEEAANSQNERTNATELSKENKRWPDPEEDHEAHPRKQLRTADVAANDDEDSDCNSSEGNESRAGNIKVTLEMILAPHQLPISFVAHVTKC